MKKNWLLKFGKWLPDSVARVPNGSQVPKCKLRPDLYIKLILLISFLIIFLYRGKEASFNSGIIFLALDFFVHVHVY